jgi:hypothetical protein
MPEPTSWPARIGMIAVPVFAVGWFFLEWLAIGESVSDAIGEAIGAGLGLLLALSVVGAAVSARQWRRAGN